MQDYSPLPASPAHFVGRHAQLATLDAVLTKSLTKPCAVFVIGEGGIGKTRFAANGIDRFRAPAVAAPKYSVAEHLVDFYHTQTHTKFGLADAIYSVLPEETETRLQKLRTEIMEKREKGDWTGMVKVSDAGLALKEDYLVALSQVKAPLVALDTAERIGYQVGERSLEQSEAWHWLAGFIPRLKSGTFLFAGRQAALDLARDLNGKVDVTIIDLGGFSLEESIQYFATTAQEAEENNEEKRARRIRALDRNFPEKIHVLSGGRPISLSLLVDIAALGNPPPTFLTESLEEVKAKAAADKKEAQKEIEQQLVSRMIESSMGEMLIALGRARKGVDAKLLAQLMGLDENTAQERMDEFAKLAISRTRIVESPGEETGYRRLFLHDEMYDILNRNVYAEPDDVAPAASAIEILKAYYRTEIKNCLDELGQKYLPIAEGREDFIPRYASVHLRRRRLNVENIYYRLRFDLLDGFGFYYRYSREATRNHDTQLDYQLQFEIQEFLNELQKNENQSELQQIAAAQVRGVILLRPVVRAFMDENWSGAIAEIARIRYGAADIVTAGAPGTGAILDVWEAYNRVFRASEETEDLKVAAELLDKNIPLLRERLAKLEKAGDQSVQTWRTKAVLAFAYQVQGYYFSETNEFKDSTDAYQIALRLWRDLDVQGELALCNNDYGFVLGELGKYSQAKQLVEDGHRLRTRYGWPEMIGLSYNTLATIQIAEGDYQAGRENSERALRLFELAPEGKRRRALAHLTQVEALRRLAGSDKIWEQDDKIKLLQEAIQNAEEAVKLATEIGETNRLGLSLIELGCAYRTWVKILNDAGEEP